MKLRAILGSFRRRKLGPAFISISQHLALFLVGTLSNQKKGQGKIRLAPLRVCARQPGGIGPARYLLPRLLGKNLFEQGSI